MEWRLWLLALVERLDGPILCLQWIFPWPTANAITSPSMPWPPLCALHGGRLRNASYTVPCACGPIAGDAATQRCARYFHAYLPVFSLTAANVPAFVEKNNRSKPIEGGNSTRLPAW